MWTLFATSSSEVLCQSSSWRGNGQLRFALEAERFSLWTKCYPAAEGVRSGIVANES